MHFINMISRCMLGSHLTTCRNATMPIIATLHSLKYACLLGLCCLLSSLTAQAKSLILILDDGSVQVVNSVTDNTRITAGQVRIIDGVSIFYDGPQVSPPASSTPAKVVILTP